MCYLRRGQLDKLKGTGNFKDILPVSPGVQRRFGPMPRSSIWIWMCISETPNRIGCERWVVRHSCFELNIAYSVFPELLEEYIRSFHVHVRKKLLDLFTCAPPEPIRTILTENVWSNTDNGISSKHSISKYSRDACDRIRICKLPPRVEIVLTKECKIFRFSPATTDL